MYKIYDVTISYYSSIDKTDSFSYMCILDSRQSIYEDLFNKHISEYSVSDIEYKEIKFDGFDIVISKSIQ